MKVAQTTTLKSISAAMSTATPQPASGGMPSTLPAGRKAAMGGGWITTPAVAAHVRKQMAAKSRQSTQE